MTAGFDMETRSLANLKRVGSYRYAEDPSTRVLCIGYAFGDEPPKLWHPKLPDPVDLLDHIERGGEVSGWNIGGFDCPVWNAVLVPQYGWPRIEIEQQIDTMAQACAMHLPQSLAECAREVGMPADKQKDKRGKYLIQRLCTPKKRRNTGELYFVEDETLLNELFDYCKQDVVAERALARRLRPLIDSERRFWQVTQRINRRGVPVDVEEVKRILHIVGREKQRLNGIAAAKANGAFSELSQLDKVKHWMRSHGVKVESLDKDAVAAMRECEDLPETVREVVELHAAVNQTSISKYSKMLEMVCDDGRIKGGIVFHGASTGRDASRGLNMQNIVRPRIKEIDEAHEILGDGDWQWANAYYGDQTLDACVACVRGVLKAPPGMRFLDADYSSIENRVGAWLSDHKPKIEMFVKGLDEYKVFASESLYRIPYEEITKAQRQVAKSAVLGCMFGQGWRGLIEYAKGYGVELTEERSQEIVEAYRAEYKPVQRMWYACGDAAIRAVQNPGTMVIVGKYLRLLRKGAYLMMRLPSGRTLYWFQPRVEEQKTPWGEMRPVVTATGIDTFTRKWQRSRIIGSSFYQSAVQAIAADIMRKGCLDLEDAGYEIVMRIHDEYLALMPEGIGSLDEMIQIIRRVPEWAKGLPIDGEGWEGQRFRKD